MIAAALVAVLALPSPQDPQKPTPRPSELTWTGVLDEQAFAALHELKKGEAPSLAGKTIDLPGTDTKAYLSLPKGGKPTAGVVVIHEWWGLNDHVRHWADRLAADGYAAIAVDLYRGTVAVDRDTALTAMQAVDPKQATAALLAAHQYLKEKVKVERRACIGWCFGGGWSLRLAMAAPDLDAAVIYYGRLVTENKQLQSIEAPILGIFGNRDRGIPPEAVDKWVDAMAQADKKVTVHRYDANHAFANPSSARYDGANAKKAWTEVRKFLKERLARLEKKEPTKEKGE